MLKYMVAYWIPPAFTRVTPVTCTALVASAIILRFFGLKLQMNLLFAIIQCFEVPRLQLDQLDAIIQCVLKPQLQLDQLAATTDSKYIQ